MHILSSHVKIFDQFWDIGLLEQVFKLALELPMNDRTSTSSSA